MGFPTPRRKETLNPGLREGGWGFDLSILLLSQSPLGPWQQDRRALVYALPGVSQRLGVSSDMMAGQKDGWKRERLGEMAPDNLERTL